MGGGVDVTRAAFEVGYESLTQFNLEYKRLFGLPRRMEDSCFAEIVGELAMLVPNSWKSGSVTMSSACVTIVFSLLIRA